MRNMIIVIRMLVLTWALLPSISYADGSQTAHYLELPQSVPMASLRFGEWLVEEGGPYSVTIVEEPLYGSLVTDGDEFFLPDPEFYQVGLDSFVVNLEFMDGWGQRVVEQHWIIIRSVEVIKTAGVYEDFEEDSADQPDYKEFGDPNLLKYSEQEPIEGERSLRITLRPNSPAFLRFSGPQEFPPSADSESIFYGNTDLPPSSGDDDDPILDIMGITDTVATGARVELRLVDDQWQARASADAREVGKPRLVTAWVTVPSERELGFELRQTPELIGRPGAGAFLRFKVYAEGMQIHEDWLFGTRPAGLDLDIGVLKHDGDATGEVVFDTVRGYWGLIKSKYSLLEGFETGQWSTVWQEQPGPMAVSADSSSISGSKDLEIDLSLAMRDEAWLVDPTPELASVVTSSFVLDVEALELRPTEVLRLWSLHDDEGLGSSWLALVDVRRRLDERYVIRLRVRDDSGAVHSSGWGPVATSSQRITLRWLADEGQGAAELWVEGASLAAVDSLYNAGRLAEAVRIGAWSVSLDSGERSRQPSLRLDNVINVH